MAYISLYFIIQNLIYYVCRVNISFVLRNIFLPLLLHRRKDVTHRSLHKTSLTNEEIQTRKFVEIVKYWELTTSGVKEAAAYFTRNDPAACFKQVLLFLNENKISKPKRRSELLKHAAGCPNTQPSVLIPFVWIFVCVLKKQNVLICRSKYRIFTLNVNKCIQTTKWLQIQWKCFLLLP